MEDGKTALRTLDYLLLDYLFETGKKNLPYIVIFKVTILFKKLHSILPNIEIHTRSGLLLSQNPKIYGTGLAEETQVIALEVSPDNVGKLTVCQQSQSHQTKPSLPHGPKDTIPRYWRNGETVRRDQ